MSEENVRFTGSVPELYDRYLGPLLFHDFAIDLAGRVQVPSVEAPSILEVAAGTGIATEQLRRQLPAGARIVATDLNPPMLEVAEKKLRAARLPGDVTFRQADATSLPFADASFDAVVCQFGAMFFPDKPKAASETYRVLRPRGQWLFSVWGSWGENPVASLMHDTVTTFFPHDPPQFYRVPFSMGDPVELRSLVETAGFECRKIVVLDRVLESPSAEEAAIGLVRGNPLGAAIEERAGDVNAVVAAVAGALSRAGGNHPLRLPGRIRVVDARKPG